MKALVIGGARSGSEVAYLLKKKAYDVFLTDAKPLANASQLRAAGIHVYDGEHPDMLKHYEYDLIVKNPGIPNRVSFVQHFIQEGYRIYNETEVAYRFAKEFHYAAITGTNGKTTTTTLLHHILKVKYEHAYVAGNIGVPLSSIVNEYEGNDCYVALEIAAFQLLGCDEFKPHIAACTNLTPDHLDEFVTVDDYYNAKMLLMKNMSETDLFLKNIDDEEIVKRTQNLQCRVINYSIKEKADCYIDNEVVRLYDEVLFKLEDVKIVGRHNVQNAMVAAMMAYYQGVEIELIRHALRTFRGVEHRIEYVGEWQGVKYYNDSKGTNLEATVAALHAFEQRVILIAGGSDKGTGFAALKSEVDCIQHMIVYGQTKHQLKEVYPDAIVCEILEEAVLEAKKLARNKDVILFSPMCASYDQFKNYEHRGDVFKQLVIQINDK